MKPAIPALSIALALAFAGIGTALGQEPGRSDPAAFPAATDKSAEAQVAAEQLPSYPLATCVVSGEPLGDEPVDVVRDGRLLRLCCKMCVKGVDKDPAAAIEKVNAAVIAAQKPSYPLETCVVSGEKLGESAAMQPVDHVHGTRLVRFCCKSCTRSFGKDPAKYMQKVDEALIAAQLPSYPLKTCVVSGEELGSGGMETHDLLYGTRLVRLCCKSCVKGFRRAPDAMLAKLDAAAKR